MRPLALEASSSSMFGIDIRTFRIEAPHESLAPAGMEDPILALENLAPAQGPASPTRQLYRSPLSPPSSPSLRRYERSCSDRCVASYYFATNLLSA
jgi:hypothetical protein